MKRGCGEEAGGLSRILHPGGGACPLLSAANVAESQLEGGGFALAFQKVLGEAVWIIDRPCSRRPSGMMSQFPDSCIYENAAKGLNIRRRRQVCGAEKLQGDQGPERLSQATELPRVKGRSFAARQQQIKDVASVRLFNVCTPVSEAVMYRNSYLLVTLSPAHQWSQNVEILMVKHGERCCGT